MDDDFEYLMTSPPGVSATPSAPPAPPPYTRRVAQENSCKVSKKNESSLRVRPEKNLELLFRSRIGVFAEFVCDICRKLCYPNQIYFFTLQSRNLEYIPLEFHDRKRILVCYKCKAHLISSKKYCPPRAFWNNLDPGLIPNEILVLSDVEKRLISRIIPFTKVIRLSGRWGQFGFQGQAILFGMDIFEVVDVLPRKSAEILIITEYKENLNSGPLEYSINMFTYIYNWRCRNWKIIFIENNSK